VRHLIGCTRRRGSGCRGADALLRVVGLAFVLTLLIVQAASAAPKHPFLEDFGSANEPTFAEATGLAVDQDSGDVLVIDSTTKTLSRWHADGTASNFSALGSNVIDGQGTGDGTPQNGILGEFAGSKEVQVAVDNSGGATDGNIYVTDSSHGVVDVFGSDGTYLGQLTAAGSSAFGEACGVTVDPSGAVYVAEYGGQVHRFVPSGAIPVNSDHTGSFAATEPCTLAAGAGPTAGYVFVASWGGPVTKYDAGTGSEEYVVASGASTTVSVDPATGHVYVATGDVVEEYDASGASAATLVTTIDTTSTSSVEGVAVDGDSGKVYVARSGTPHLEVFGPLPQPKHPFLEDFGSANEPTFAEATGLAVDQDSGDVLVIDSTTKTLSRWHADGTASNFSALGSNVIDGQGTGDGTPQNGILGEFAGSKEVQVAVDNSGGATDGNIYVTDSSHGVVDVFGSDGTYLGQLTAAGSSAFGEACGVTVDPSGAVYVAEYGGQVHRFVPSGAIPVNSDHTGSFAATEPCTLAAGAGPTAGYVFVASWGGPVTKYDAGTGSEEYVVASGASTTVSVDPATGHVYVATGDVVEEYDASGASAATLVTTIDTTSTSSVEGVAVDGDSGKVYVARSGTPHLEVFGPLVFGEAPAVTTGSATSIGNNAATLQGTVDPNEDATTWQFEYGLSTAYGNVAPATPASAGEGGDPVPVSTPVTGLQPGTQYHYRLRATNSSGSTTGEDMTFTTSGPAATETTGSPIRTATTARLEGRVLPTGAATTYHFEYGAEGPCDTSTCQATPTRSAGSGSEYVLVSEEISGLLPGTTYHYRVVADNGNTSGQSAGGDMTVTTRPTDAPPAPAPFPGPPGSDRGWEQVNVPDTNGNPVFQASAIADNGERVVYAVNGGTPDTSTGTAFTPVLAERTASGWRNVASLPPRDELMGPLWFSPSASGDLQDLILVNLGASGVTSFHIDWGVGFDELYEPGNSYGQLYEASADASRVIMELKGSVDPSHPAGANPHLYDITSGTPEMVSLLPGNVVPACGVKGPEPSERMFPENTIPRSSGWVSPDGSRVVFPSEGNVCDNRYQLYLRDLEAQSTALVSGPAISGPHCHAEFIKSVTDGVFFLTRSKLSADDTALSSCSGSEGNDVYRYDIDTGSLDCITCVSSTFNADLPDGERRPSSKIGVAGDGSRVYFRSPNRLLLGAAAPGFYRVEVSSGNLRYIGPAVNSNMGDVAGEGEAMNSDGSIVIFRSSAAGLNPVNGSNNGGTLQYYRYDDRDRSLVCVSCPQDGGVPIADAPKALIRDLEQAGPNLSPLDEKGDFAFVTATPLVSADENTAGAGQPAHVGADVYEWRDGQLLLVTGGDIQWAGADGPRAPGVSGFTPDGRDLFFTAPAQLTFDAMDGFSRLYDARIGGGFPPPPVSEGCTGAGCPEAPGNPPQAPADVAPATPSFSGPGDPKPKFHKKKHRKKKKHRRHKKQHHGKHKTGKTKTHRLQITESWRASR
jgi:hypothetical protein